MPGMEQFREDLYDPEIMKRLRELMAEAQRNIDSIEDELERLKEK